MCSFGAAAQEMIETMSTREVLACPDFMRLWYARLAGVGASQMMLVAIGWQMYDLTGSAWDLGLVGLLQFLPALALVLVAGHVVDRHHRARIVALCVAAQGLVALVLAAAPHGGCAGTRPRPARTARRTARRPPTRRPRRRSRPAPGRR